MVLANRVRAGAMDYGAVVLILILEVICHSLELIMQPKVALVSRKTMPRHFLNHYRTSLKNFTEQLFGAQNVSKNYPRKRPKLLTF